ncbi:hypothetical protein PGTUg99_003107 [Puccinia graminis f. sp. tritici]|uniref:Uncharacterized protein n=1 Tax=Puccinia graminis f. sp. tritici TaxID=56615 RepID=A0A5B0QZZ7_PUCGR|nr:hypothetical protein PGTUg99_003107 [Puccinia graminis f. sp. tritici]
MFSPLICSNIRSLTCSAWSLTPFTGGQPYPRRIYPSTLYLFPPGSSTSGVPTVA